jgi:predicted PhzF superfamily epimerase YddE/YHI9
VIVLSADDPWPQDFFLLQVAAEFNYAETAYVRKTDYGSENDYELRWFTPVKEVVYFTFAG